MNEELKERLYKAFKQVAPDYEPRPGQIEACVEIVESFNSGSRHVVLEAPTGSGKSLIAATIMTYLAKEFELRSVLTTVTKSLQNQYLRDFRWISDIRSSSNDVYRCNIGFVRSDLECKSQRKELECDNARQCPYKRAIKEFFASRRAMSNLQFLCNVPHLGDTDLLVMDEAHETESVVIGQTEIGLPIVNMELIRLLIPKSEDYQMFSNLWNNAEKALFMYEQDVVFEMPLIDEFVNMSNILEGVVAKLESKLGAYMEQPLFKRAYRHANSLIRAISPIINGAGFRFVQTGDREFKPIYASEFTRSKIYSKANRFLHMSATICGFDAYCEEVGIPQDEASFVEMSHPIDVERRIVNFKPAAWMSFKNYSSDIEKTANAIDILIEEHGNKNTVIHTASYKRADDIKAKSRHKIEVFKSHPDVIKYLSSSDSEKFVASPSIHAGLDAKDDMCRLNIICKLPFPSLGDPRMRYLMKADPRIYNLQVARNVVQACGRGTRGIDDHSVTYILDGNFKRLLDQYRHLMPLWFRESIRGM